jgi:DNA-binding NarL/FixJ family response regulator
MTDIPPLWATELTTRQRQVCRYMALGWNDENIGYALGISRRTVEDHRQKIYQKCKCRDRIELVRLVYDLGDPPAFLDPPRVAKSPQP